MAHSLCETCAETREEGEENGGVSGGVDTGLFVLCVGERKKGKEKEEEKERTLLPFLSPPTALTQKISLIPRKEQIMRSGILISKSVIYGREVSETNEIQGFARSGAKLLVRN